MGEVYESEVRIVAESLHPGDGRAIMLRRRSPHWGERLGLRAVQATITEYASGRRLFSARIELSGKPTAVTMNFARQPDGTWIVRDGFGYLWLRAVCGESRIRVLEASCSSR